MPQLLKLPNGFPKQKRSTKADPVPKLLYIASRPSTKFPATSFGKRNATHKYIECGTQTDADELHTVERCQVYRDYRRLKNESNINRVPETPHQEECIPAESFIDPIPQTTINEVLEVEEEKLVEIRVAKETRDPFVIKHSTPQFQSDIRLVPEWYKPIYRKLLETYYKSSVSVDIKRCENEDYVEWIENSGWVGESIGRKEYFIQSSCFGYIPYLSNDSLKSVLSHF